MNAAAIDAGSELAWSITGRPSHFTEAPADLLKRIGPLQSLRDDAEADPAAFVAALFGAIDNAVSDAAGEVREAAVRDEERYGVVGQFTPR